MALGSGKLVQLLAQVSSASMQSKVQLAGKRQNPSGLAG